MGKKRKFTVKCGLEIFGPPLSSYYDLPVSIKKTESFGPGLGDTAW